MFSNQAHGPAVGFYFSNVLARCTLPHQIAMATTYTNTVTINCLKQHTCLCCGAIYTYPFVRKVKGSGRTREAAQKDREKKVARTLAQDVNLEPCPTCGLYQPDMIGQPRADRHKTVFIIAIFVFAFLLILRAADVLMSNTATLALMIAAALMALVHTMAEVRNLNSDLDANKQKAEDKVGAGKMILTPGKLAVPTMEQVNPPKSGIHKLAIPLLVLSVVLIAAPEAMRSLSRWPLNSDAYPPVVGPTDTTRIYMPEKISSVKGYWSTLR